MADKRITDLIELTAGEVASKADVFFGVDRIDVVPDVSRKVALDELQAMTDITPEWIVVVIGDPTSDAQVISAIRGQVTTGRVKAKYVGTGSATNPDYAFELSGTDDLTRLKVPDTLDTNTNFTTAGGLPAAVENTTIDMGGFSLAFSNTSGITLGAATTVSGAVTTSSVVLSSGGDTVTLTEPAGILETYTVEYWTQLPTAGQVSSDANFVRIDENGSLSFSAVSGTSANLSLGTVTGTSLDIDIDTGDSVTIPIADASDAGLLSAADKVIIDSVAGLPTEDTYFTKAGSLPAATEAKVIDMGTNSLSFTNVTTASIDAVLTASGITLTGTSEDIAITAPAALAASYPIELMDDLPTLGEVSSDANFLKIDSTGKVTFGLPPGGDPGGATNITIGNMLADTFDVQSSTGTDATLTGATALKAGILVASDKVLIDTIPSKLETVNLTAGAQTATTYEIANSGGANLVLPAVGANAGLMTAADKTLLDSLPTATNLSLGTIGANTVDILSSSGDDITFPAVTQSSAGCMTAADKTLLDGLPTEDTNILTSALPLPAATANRDIDLGGNALNFQNVTTFTATAATQVVLTTPIISAPNARVDISTLRVDSGTGYVTLAATGDANYTMTTWAALPTPTDVANGANVVRIDDTGQLLFGTVPTSVTDLGIGPRDGVTLDITSSTGDNATIPTATPSLCGLLSATDKGKLDGLPIADFSESVATKANRTANPDTVGYRSFVESNQVEYEWDGAAYQIYKAEATGSSTERNAMTELEDGQVFNDITLGKALAYSTSAPAGWYEQGVS
jgi:hypothetical protein